MGHSVSLAHIVETSFYWPKSPSESLKDFCQLEEHYQLIRSLLGSKTVENGEVITELDCAIELIEQLKGAIRQDIPIVAQWQWDMGFPKQSQSVRTIIRLLFDYLAEACYLATLNGDNEQITTENSATAIEYGVRLWDNCSGRHQFRFLIKL